MKKYRVTFDFSNMSATGTELLAVTLNTFAVLPECELTIKYPLAHLDTSSNDLMRSLIVLRADYEREFNAK